MPPLIAHIVYALDTGGLENGLVNIINRMPSDQFRHMVICLTTSGKFSERIEKPDVPVIELNKSPGHDLGSYKRLWQVLRQYRPDIVHSRNLAALEAQLVTLGLPGTKRIHGEHGRDMSDLDGSNWKYTLFRSLTRPLIDHYIAVSEDLKNWLLDRVGVNPLKIRQIYNGVDLTKFTNQTKVRSNHIPPSLSDEHNLVIGTVGRLTPVKDQQGLLDAVALLLKLNPSFVDRLQLLIVGDGALRNALELHAKKLGLSEQVWFVGDREDVPQLLQCMDIFVLPSLAEGISNTLLEAMACSLPVVATRVGGTPEIIADGEQGLLVQPQNPDALARALLQLLNDEVLRKQYGSSGRKKVERFFNWESTVSNYADVYLGVLPGQTQRAMERHS